MMCIANLLSCAEQGILPWQAGLSRMKMPFVLSLSKDYPFLGADTRNKEKNGPSTGSGRTETWPN
ncbi:MAG: hypothetical protein WBL20_10695, partial [Sphingobium sp.]